MLGEQYENRYGNVTACTGHENRTCANRFTLKETNTEDHMWYLGHYMGCYIPFVEFLFYY